MFIQNRCYLCGIKEENAGHLFFECEYSKRCVQLVEAWIQRSLPVTSPIQWWLYHRFGSLLEK